MDIYCTNCGAAWGVGEDPNEDIINARNGECWECDGDPKMRNWFGNAKSNRPSKAEASALMFDMLGDDIDGVASMLDDFSYLGMID